MVGKDLETVRRVSHRQRRVQLKDARELTRVVRIEVLDDDQRQAGSRGQCPEELRERLEAAGRGAHAHDREGIRGWLAHRWIIELSTTITARRRART